MNHTSLIFSRTITKITIPIELTPYLQITTIANKPLNPMIIIRIYVYMTTHEEDIHIIPHIHQTFKQILTTHSTYFPILIGDFNRDIFLIGYHNQHSITQLTNQEREWRTFTTNLQLTPIPRHQHFQDKGNPTTTTLASQTSSIPPTPTQCTNVCRTNMQLHLNSDHFLVTLHLPPLYAIHKPPPSPTNTIPQSIYPIPDTNVQTFLIKFNKLNFINVQPLTKLLQEAIILTPKKCTKNYANHHKFNK